MRQCLRVTLLVVLLLGGGMVEFVTPVAAQDQSEAGRAAEAVLKQCGRNRGVCACVNRRDGVAFEIARNSELLVHLRLSGADARDAANSIRRRATDAGFGIDRFVVETGPAWPLPYADNLVGRPGRVGGEFVDRFRRPTRERASSAHSARQFVY